MPGHLMPVLGMSMRKLLDMQALESEVSKSKSQIQCMEDLLQVTNKELRQTVEQLEVCVVEC